MDNKKELSEAIAACDRANSTLNEALGKLESAKGWGIFDIIGGGLVSSYFKHNKIDEAESLINELESDMEVLEKELFDIRISLDEYETPNSLNRTLDIFLDNIFSDWNTQSTINNNIETLNIIKNTLDKLKLELEKRLSKIDEDDYKFYDGTTDTQ